MEDATAVNPGGLAGVAPEAIGAAVTTTDSIATPAGLALRLRWGHGDSAAALAT